MSDDLISRQEVLNKLNKLDQQELYLPCYFKEYVIDKVSNIPQKTGHWIDVSGDVPIYNAGGFTEKRKIGVKCSNCQRLNTWCEFDYCPHCGAKMEGEAE